MEEMKWEKEKVLEEDEEPEKIKVALRMIFELRLKFHVVACYGKGSFWLRTLFFFFAFIPSTFAPSL